MAQARDRHDADDVSGLWVAAGTAYRDWARREPQQFALILGMPMPGYVAPEDGPTTDAAKDAMAQLRAAVHPGRRAGRAQAAAGA